MQPGDAVVRFIESIGQNRESQFYLQLFRATKEQFATICVDAEVMRDADDAVAMDLRYLALLRLTPVVVFGLFDPSEAEKSARAMEQRLVAHNVDARTCLASATEIADLVQRGTIPIIWLQGLDKDGHTARQKTLATLLGDLQSRKLIYLSHHGGLRQNEIVLPFVNMTTELASVRATATFSPRQALLLDYADDLLKTQTHRLAITLTSPFDLLRELFTVKGAGTLLRRGAVVRSLEIVTDDSRARLADLLASSFGRLPTDGFFDQRFSRVYVEQNFRGAAMLIDTPLGAYLSKFVVDREAQGEGIARDLWDVLVAHVPTFFWRARQSNPINPWYAKHCDGLSRHGQWDVYWKRLAPAKIADAIAFALAQPVDL